MTQGWWHTASTEQRLAQIDGGIECGLNARQISMAVGVDPDDPKAVKALTDFAINRLRNFPGSHSDRARSARNLRLMARVRLDLLTAADVEDSSEFRLDDVEA